MKRKRIDKCIIKRNDKFGAKQTITLRSSKMERKISKIKRKRKICMKSNQPAEIIHTAPTEMKKYTMSMSNYF